MSQQNSRRSRSPAPSSLLGIASPKSSRSESVRGDLAAHVAVNPPVSNPFVMPQPNKSTGATPVVSKEATTFISAVADVWDKPPKKTIKSEALKNAKEYVNDGSQVQLSYAVSDLYIACGLSRPAPKVFQAVSEELVQIALATAPELVLPLSKHPKVHIVEFG